MSNPYRVKDIVWAVPNARLPTEAVVTLSDHLVLSGVEDWRGPLLRIRGVAGEQRRVGRDRR